MNAAILVDVVGAVRTVSWFVAAGVAGVVAHELTHYTVARLIGRRNVKICWLSADTIYTLPEGGPRLGDYAVGWAPFVIGVVIGAGTLVGTWGLSLAAAIGWGIYTFGGLPDDLWVSVRGESNHRDDRRRHSDVQNHDRYRRR